MSWNLRGHNILELARNLDPLTKLSQMRTGPKDPSFFTETKDFVYEQALRLRHEESNLMLGTRINPVTGLPLHAPAYYCHNCAVERNLNVYFHRMNTNLDHQDSWYSLITFHRPTVDLQVGFNQVRIATENAGRMGLLPTDYENLFTLNWDDKRHRQLLYNDIKNLEVVCAGHNRIKGNFSQEESLASSYLIEMQRHGRW